MSAAIPWSSDLQKRETMQPEITFDRFWIVETRDGTELIPADLIGDTFDADSALTYMEQCHDAERIESAELVESWFCRLSMPGYLDCTSWAGPFKSEREAMRYLVDTFDGEMKRDNRGRFTGYSFD